MSDAVLVALIGLAGVAITAGPNYLSHRKTRRQQAEAIDAALTPVAARLDQLGDDVAEIKTRVAIHDDRWSRVPLRAVAENRITPESRG